MSKYLPLVLMVGFACIPLQATASARNCSIENATYRLKSNPAVLAHFVKVQKVEGLASDVAFEFTVPEHEAYWYTFDRGTDPYINMVSISDPTAPGYVPPVMDSVKRPHGDMQYLAISDGTSFDDRLPVSGQAAPELILLPLFPNLRLTTEEHSFFEFTSCSKK